jgi:predicted RNase H-like HicB family nuclease
LLFHVISKAWVGISDDVPGLYVGAGTLEELMQTANELIPELLILNGVLPHERQPELEGLLNIMPITQGQSLILIKV